jgi:hypothetical protein
MGSKREGYRELERPLAPLLPPATGLLVPLPPPLFARPLLCPSGLFPAVSPPRNFSSSCSSTYLRLLNGNYLVGIIGVI